MTEEILINVTPQETRVAVIENGVVQELHVERAASRGLVGNIYMGRVVRVLPGMQSAFIEIGLERAAFLHVADIWEERQNGERPRRRARSSGSSPRARRSWCRWSRTRSAPRARACRPRSRSPGACSSTCRRTRTSASRSGSRTRPAGSCCARSCSSCCRPTSTAASSCAPSPRRPPSAELATDIAYLRKLWGYIRERAQTSHAPALLHQDLSLAQRVLRDFVHEDTGARSWSTRARTSSSCRPSRATTCPRCCRSSSTTPASGRSSTSINVEEEIEKALARRVELKSGGYLIIDQTEALTTIDVNTGGFVGGRNFDDTIFKTNLEAAQAIARQLRLRNLGGIIILDFIDMESEDHREAVLAEFRKALARDRTKMTVNGFTQLGLVEMTRKRTRESLAHVLCEPCPTCSGRGVVKTARTVCYEILREILREARQFNAERVPHPRRAERDRPVPRRGVAVARDARRLHRQAGLDAGGDELHAGAVRHRPDVDPEVDPDWILGVRCAC